MISYDEIKKCEDLNDSEIKSYSIINNQCHQRSIK
jgi:hypothetical protein